MQSHFHYLYIQRNNIHISDTSIISITRLQPSIIPRSTKHNTFRRTSITMQPALRLTSAAWAIAQRPFCTQVTSNYFKLLGVTERFDLDLSHLSTQFKSLQRKWHPDRHATATSATAQSEAARISAQLNEAYAALRSPHTRALHLLSLHGIEDSADMCPDFLAWVVETREKIASIPPSSSAAHKTAAEVEAAIGTCVSELQHLFDTRQLAAARIQTAKLNYLCRMRAAAQDLL